MDPFAATIAVVLPIVLPVVLPVLGSLGLSLS